MGLLRRLRHIFYVALTGPGQANYLPVQFASSALPVFSSFWVSLSPQTFSGLPSPKQFCLKVMVLKLVLGINYNHNHRDVLLRYFTDGLWF